MKEIFFCPEESKFYSHCLEAMIFPQCNYSDVVVEFGSGDGSPVINSLLRTNFTGQINGFELNKSAWQVANSTIEEYNLGEQYIIHNQSFFDSQSPAKCLISNPPYLPAPDNNIYLPLLHGGTDGATLTKQLLTLDYKTVLLMISSFSDPEGTIRHANAEGYAISDFTIVPLPFGKYSSEPKVKQTIEVMRKQNTAFYSDSVYLLAGVVFKKQNKSTKDLSTELCQLMTAL